MRRLCELVVRKRIRDQQEAQRGWDQFRGVTASRYSREREAG